MCSGFWDDSVGRFSKCKGATQEVLDAVERAPWSDGKPIHAGAEEEDDFYGGAMRAPSPKRQRVELNF